MANKCPNIGIVVALMATAGILYTVASKYWKQNSPVSSQNHVVGLQSYQGLWVRCVSPTPDRFNCDYYDVSYLGLPVFLQVLRGLMVVAAIAGAAGILLGMVGLECVSAMEESKTKLWTGRCGGILLLLAGALCVVSVSWYAADIIYDFSLSEHDNDIFVYEFGSALYVGWVASFLAIVSGIMLTCCNCASSSDETRTSTYMYQPSKPSGRSAEYV